MPKSKTERELEILFPFKEVTLTLGDTVVVREWDIDTGALATGHVTQLFQKLQAAQITGNVEVKRLLEIAMPEMQQLVALTIGWTLTELKKRCSWDDFMALTQAVIDTSLVKPEGGGALPKMVELVQAMGAVAQAPAQTNRSQRRSTSSSHPDTPSAN